MKTEPKLPAQQQSMSDKAFASMVKRNGMTHEKLESLRASLERGRALIESSKKLIAGRKLA